VPDGGRIIGGTARGLRLRAPGEGTRPLGDRVKQALFGSLVAEGVVGEGRRFLDLYAGSGAGGIEALSRGSELAVFVEKDGGACTVIGENLRLARLAGGQTVRAAVLSFLDGGSARHGAPFDAVLIDPPYAEPLLEPTLTRLADAERGWLAAEAVVVAKHFWRDEPPPTIAGLEAFRHKRFGETALTFYRWQDDTAAEDP
jgi:16S rRNA (guanine966-N2)-methyltransferase